MKEVALVKREAVGGRAIERRSGEDRGSWARGWLKFHWLVVDRGCACGLAGGERVAAQIPWIGR
jgi:hypothetical protein